jgi:hypothetical protein
MTDLDLEAVKGEDHEKDGRGRAVGEMTLDFCSANESSGSKPRGNGEEARKEREFRNKRSV